jgi:hypothetical protein
MQIYLAESEKKLKQADYLLTQTYPIIKDPKLLAVIAENLKTSLKLLLDAFLAFYKNKGDIKGVPLGSGAKRHFFNELVAFKYKKDLLSLLETLEDLKKFKDESPIEFRRRERLVMCSDEYNVRVLDEQMVKEMLGKTKLFINEAFTIIS